MIPVELGLKNFMSYGEGFEPLNFTGFHMACLTGNNGNGKSSLLDAMTWALWGQARGVDKNGSGMDDLVRLGADHMEVEFTFLIEDNTYRIIRKRDKKKGLSALELQVKEELGFRSITGDKIAATQEKIEQILKIDYETFVNSAFVLQGKADTFTQQKPNDRKRILGEILGLSYYEKIERKARDKVNHYDQVSKQIDDQLLNIDKELANKPDYELQLAEVSIQLQSITTEMLSLESEVMELRAKKKELEDVQKRITELKERIKANGPEIHKLNTNIAQLELRINSNSQYIEKKDEIVSGYEKYQQTSILNNQLNEQATKVLQLSQEKNQIEKNLQSKQQDLEKMLSDLRAEINYQGTLAKDRVIKEVDYKSLKKQYEAMQVLEKERGLREEELKKIENSIASLSGQLEARNNSLEELRKRFLQIKALNKCPFCETSIENPGDLERMVSSFTMEANKSKEEIDGVKKEINQLETSRNQINQQLEPIIRRLKDKEQVQNNMLVREQQWKNSCAAEDFIKSKQATVKELETALQEVAVSGEDRRAVAQLEEQIGAIGYDNSRHQEIRNLVSQMEPFNEQHKKLALAESELKQDREYYQQLKESLIHRQQALDNDKELCSFYEDREKLLSVTVPKLEQVEGSLIELRRKASKLEERKGIIQERLNRCLSLEKERNTKTALREKAVMEKKYYNKLVEAFGRKGIQAIIIENAIPELQDEANNLLAQMTDGRLNLELVTQKGNKKGNLVETLDIEISDEMGKRKYEMYSGGEAFRVNFALRLALSKLLTKRAGAKLQTLVIDEGFGTQDAQGKERLVEVINAIKDDFAKIIVITHIQELKEVFPVHIEVIKTRDGSEIKIV